MVKKILFLIIFLFFQTTLSFGEISDNKWRFAVYGGIQDVSGSKVKAFTDNGTSLDFDANWEGKSLSMPPYWGIRASFWDTSSTAWEIDFVHSKAYATSSTLTDNGLEHFQFTDGVNVLSLSRIWQSENQIKARNLSPYIGVGGGVNLPYVEIIKTTAPSIARTMGYQFGGFSGQIQAGVRYPVNPNLNAIFEYSSIVISSNSVMSLILLLRNCLLRFLTCESESSIIVFTLDKNCS